MSKFWIAAAAATLICAPAAAQTIKQEVPLTNDTEITIAEVYISPTTENEWGDDLLGDNVFQNTQTATITFTRPEESCQWDIKAVFEGGESVVWKGLNFCEISKVGLVYSAETGEATAVVE